jgi:hypothetical protein
MKLQTRNYSTFIYKKKVLQSRVYNFCKSFQKIGNYAFFHSVFQILGQIFFSPNTRIIRMLVGPTKGGPEI